MFGLLLENGQKILRGSNLALKVEKLLCPINPLSGVSGMGFARIREHAHVYINVVVCDCWLELHMGVCMCVMVWVRRSRPCISNEFGSTSNPIPIPRNVLCI